MLGRPVLSCQGFPIFSAPFPTSEGAQSLPALTNNRRTLGKSQPRESSGAWRRVEQIKLCTRWPAAV